MLGTREIAMLIQWKLKRVSEALSKYGVKVRSLSKLAHKTGVEEPEFVSIIAPQTKGIEPTQYDGIQEVTYLVIIRVSLSNLFSDDPKEANNIEWCTDNIVNDLLGFIPFQDKRLSRKPLWLQGTDLLQPTNGVWENEIRFQCSKLLYVQPDLSIYDPAQLVGLELYASPTLTEIGALLIDKMP